MTQNFSNNNDNRPSIKSNDPFIQNTPPNSVLNEGVSNWKQDDNTTLLKARIEKTDFQNQSNTTLYGFVEQSVTQQDYRAHSDILLETDTHSEFLKGVGLSPQEYNNLFDSTNRMQVPNQSQLQYDNSMHNEFLQNIGLSQNEYNNLFDPTNRVQVSDSEWANSYPTDSNTGVNNSVSNNSSNSAITTGKIYYVDFSCNYKVSKVA